MTERIEIPRPDDWHVHFRDGDVLRSVVPHTSRVFARAVVMPNLRPPVTTVAAAMAYRARIVQAVPPGVAFEPLMTLYLTPTTTPEEIAVAAAHPAIVGVKLYPAGATTNAQAGVADLDSVTGVLEAMQELRLPLLVHGESIDPACDPFDREAEFVQKTLGPLIERFPRLRVVLEHVTTAEGAAFVRDAPDTVAGTLTPQHLLYDRRALFEGGLRPHMYCLPVLKRAHHRDALLEAATASDGKFFAGTDSAPHEIGAKESSCGCAGIYNSPTALQLYAEAFDLAGALPALEAFVSRNGPAFYGRAVNVERVALERRPCSVPESYPLGGGVVAPLRAGASVMWSIVP
ncbi:MAG: dihydroorotase [Nannocystaceae bacterium]|nr:dihydroorotase [Nannocystaceae bacterium]